MKKKRKCKVLFVFSLVGILLFGSVISVYASEDFVYDLSSVDSSFYFHIAGSENDDEKNMHYELSSLYVENNSSPVYVLPYHCNSGLYAGRVGVVLFSKNSFSSKCILNSFYQCGVTRTDESGGHYTSLQSSRFTSYYDNSFYYLDLFNMSPGYVRSCSAKYYDISCDHLTFIGNYILNNLIDDSITIIDVDYGYSDSVSTSIAPPSDVSYFEAIRPAQSDYYFQLGWADPLVDDLLVEISVDVKYKGSYLAFNRNYLHSDWVTYKDGLSASSLKKNGYVRELSRQILDAEGITYSDSYITIDTIYVRFVKLNEETGTLDYSLWTKLFLDRNDEWYEPFINSSTGNTGYFDSDGNWVDSSLVDGSIVDGSDSTSIISPGFDDNGNNIVPDNDVSDHYDITDVDKLGTTLVNALETLFSSVGRVPQIIGNFFQFLPGEIVSLIAVGIAMILVLRVLGR